MRWCGRRKLCQGIKKFNLELTLTGIFFRAYKEPHQHPQNLSAKMQMRIQMQERSFYSKQQIETVVFI